MRGTSVSANGAFALGVLAILITGCSGPEQPPRAARSVQVHFDSMGVHGVAPLDLGILVYADGPASVKFGARPLHQLVDTVRLRSTPSFMLDVSNGAVNVEFVDGQLGGGGGVLLLSGYIVGADSVRVRGVGRHLLVEKGGNGIRVIDRGNPRLMREDSRVRANSVDGQGLRKAGPM